MGDADGAGAQRSDGCTARFDRGPELDLRPGDCNIHNVHIKVQASSDSERKLLQFHFFKLKKVTKKLDF